MWSSVEQFIERYFVRMIALVIYFSGFPLLTSVVFSLSSGSFVQAFFYALTATGLFAASILILESKFGRDSIRILLISSSWPFVLFLLFNISFTAVYAHSVYSALKEGVGQFFFSDVTSQVLLGYERIVPKLWVTAILYGSALLGFALAQRGQRRFREESSRTDQEH